MDSKSMARAIAIWYSVRSRRRLWARVACCKPASLLRWLINLQRRCAAYQVWMISGFLSAGLCWMRSDNNRDIAGLITSPHGLPAIKIAVNERLYSLLIGCEHQLTQLLCLCERSCAIRCNAPDAWKNTGSAAMTWHQGPRI